jgi:hypothetical protein
MALGLNRIWVRFGLWITAAVLLAIASLAIGVLAFPNCSTASSIATCQAPSGPSWKR